MNNDDLDFNSVSSESNVNIHNQASDKTNNDENETEEDYSGFVPASEEDFNNSGNIQTENVVQNDTNPQNSDYNQEQDGDDNEEELSQEKKILDQPASEKIDVSKLKKNKGVFLQRGKIITIFIGIILILLIFFSMVMPSITSRKKKEKNKELDKAGVTNVPNTLQRYTDNYQEQNVIFEDGNSTTQKTNNVEDEDFDKKYPPVLDGNNNQKQQNVAPVSVPSQGSSTTDVPITNRNEQQKQIQRLSLDHTDSPTQKQRSGNHYGESGPTGYNTGYNTGYTGTSTNAAYTPQSLTGNIDKFIAQQTGSQNMSSYEQQNNQSSKQQFLNKNGIGGNYQWNSDYSIWKGTVISAILDTGINTDLPGSVMGHVTKNIYSSQDGKYLLIPMGSRLYGEYNSDISYGQSRVQVVWNTLIRPDGLEVNLGSMNGIDAYGYSGYKGWKTDHPFEYVKAFGLIAMYSVLDTKMNNTISSQNNAYAQNALTDVYAETKRLNNKIVDRALDIQPTNTIKSGTEINLITNVTIDLPPMEAFEVEEKYVLHK